MIGWSAADVTRWIVEQDSRIASVALFSYIPPPPVQLRAPLSSEAILIVQRGLELKTRSGFPFWDSVMISCLGENAGIDSLLDACLHQQSPLGNFVISRSEILAGRVANAVAQSKSAAIALSSCVSVVDGDSMHLKMMDFQCSSSASNLPVVHSVMRRLAPEGFFILHSGKSFHGYGTALQTEEQMYDFVGRALLFAPIIDRVYLAHRLIERKLSLRISGGGDDKVVPTVVRVGGPTL